jgi:transposase
MKGKIITLTSEHLKQKYAFLSALLTERTRRAVFAADAISLGRGGISLVSSLSGVSRMTLHAGIKELKQKKIPDENGAVQIRKAGGGRKKKVEVVQGLVQAVEDLVNPYTLGDPMNSYLYTSKSLRKLAEQLGKKGFKVSHRLVGDILVSQGYSLQANHKSLEGGSQEYRDAQFEYINRSIRRFFKEENPVVSVDCKKKELIGNFKNNGTEWQPKGEPIEVEAYDFINKSAGKAIPYGVYDVFNNEGWVSVGIDHDTAAFAVNSIKQWWTNMGVKKFGDRQRLLILADGGGSNGSKNRLWKKCLQELSNELNMEISVSHLPPGTSKWNKIEHKMFSFISINWRARPLVCLQTVVKLIASTTTQTGLKIKARVNKKKYQTGIKVTNSEMENINLKRSRFQGNWNYVIKPTL